MPDNANCNFSHFSDCSFHVCRLYGVKFWDTRLYGCEFHSCRIEFTLFPDSTLANTHFRDCSIHSAAFLRSRMTRCNTVDCSVGRLNFNGARLDGCTYGRITRLPNSRIEGLEDASITMGGATQKSGITVTPFSTPWGSKTRNTPRPAGTGRLDRSGEGAALCVETTP